MGYRILALIESESQLAELTSLCAENGHEIVSMHTISDAMIWLNSKDHIDVIVSDTYLHNEGVFDFLRAVKTDHRHKWVQFVMLSTNQTQFAEAMNTHITNTARVLGADKYIVMPEFSAIRLLKELAASFPEMAPQAVQDPIRDAAGVPRPAEETPETVTEAQDATKS